MTSTTVESVCVCRRLRLTTDQAWDAWTTPGGLQAWWWADDPYVTYSADAHLGGRYRIHSASSGLGIRATVLAADRPTRVVLRWRWLGARMPAVDDLVQVSFAVDDGDVVVALQESMRPGSPTRGCQRRWNTVMDALAGLEPPPIGWKR